VKRSTRRLHEEFLVMRRTIRKSAEHVANLQHSPHDNSRRSSSKPVAQEKVRTAADVAGDNWRRILNSSEE
jgi:hypothetical protein